MKAGAVGAATRGVIKSTNAAEAGKEAGTEAEIREGESRRAAENVTEESPRGAGSRRQVERGESIYSRGRNGRAWRRGKMIAENRKDAMMIPILSH